ncbi:uncharacterized protein si:ch211-191i18.2 isoform X2 [Lampris incognitus]|uniref:uncharacterized protein si:ch211-191i18.2 isoform X2 n=1 Tax=Lampris incognitus TaxID=2546036 RepID=UPI0024B567BD|nr:uncharacterized protein si:ch211-191i18.2 isoform X2 [Lampris incognitus]
MIRLLSFWLAGCLLLPSCWGNGGNNSHEEKYDFSIQTPTPEYDYNATFDYVFYTINGQEWDYELNSTDIFNKTISTDHTRQTK